jgi:gamma-glutamyltranspeptidase/glutathione hydrolase
MKPFIGLLASANARPQRSEDSPQVMNGPDGCPRPAPEGNEREASPGMGSPARKLSPPMLSHMLAGGYAFRAASGLSRRTGENSMTFTTRPEIAGTFGMVASTHWLASAAGMAMLERGGNAFDAAVATGFVLQVVEPHLNGPGGEVPIILHDARGGAVEVICGQGTAPAGATIAHYRGLGLDLVPGGGLLATVIPGSFDAWMLLLRDHGTLGPREVLEPAIGYAEGGCPLVPRIPAAIAEVEALFRDEWPTSAAVYLPGGQVPAAGGRFRNPALAETYKRLLSEAEARSADRDDRIEALRDAWYRGFVAEAMAAFCRDNELMDTSGRRHAGVLSADDMARWQATKEKPATYDCWGYTFCKGGPWSQGPMFLQQLALLSGVDLPALDPLGPDFVHLVTEGAKLAFADRETFYGDPDFVNVPLKTLLSADYNAARQALIGERASHELRPGSIPGYGAEIDMAAAVQREANLEADLGAGEPTVQKDSASGDTCHLDVVDRHGNMVSATPSGGWLQSSPVIPELGFGLNSRAQMFWLDEAHPAGLAPGKRPRTTLSANLLLRDGEPYMVFGTPGGDSQDQWTFTFALRHLHHGMNLQEAIDAPMFQTDHAPSSFWPRGADPGSLRLEGRFPAATIEELERRGHRVTVEEDWSLGRLSAATRDGGLLKAAANPRMMQGYAVGR